MSTFHVNTARAFAKHCPVAGKVVYEVGSDSQLQSARAFVELGAATVIATSLGHNWFQRPVPSGVIATTADVRRASDNIGGETVDIVYGVNVLEHIHDLDLALASIHEILRPDGAFLLHGHPIWTCATGHHILYESTIERYRFDNETNPIPPWGHLYMDKEEMTYTLTTKGVTAEAIERMVDFIYGDDRLNRMPLRAIEKSFEASPLCVKRTIEDVSEILLDNSIRGRLRDSPWWDGYERYAVRQIFLSGSKRACLV